MMSANKSVVSLSKAKIYQHGALVLSDIDFEVSQGDFIYLIGRTGSGKSSLLRALYGDVEIQGDATVAGYKVNQLKRKDLPFLRRKLGIIFQDFQLLTDRSIGDNLAFALQAMGVENKASIQSMLEEALVMVDLQNKRHKMPHQLSGGEQQRLVIARALLNHPELILADEPTGNLDPQTSEEILQLIFDINQKTGTPVVVATHNYALIDKFKGKTYKCEQGKLMAPVLEEASITEEIPTPTESI